jgi:leucyl-tRNA synthetase
MYGKTNMQKHSVKVMRAKALRRNMPECEAILWKKIQNSKLGAKFSRQRLIGNYYVDFICFEKKLIIELDGEQHGTEAAIKYDNKRTDFIKSQGYVLIRISNGDIKRSLNAVLNSLRLVLNGKAQAQELFVEKWSDVQS